MQDRYVGDVGDFGKFALLRTLAADRKVAVCWYRTDGSSERNGDGKHTNYLQHRHVDPHVYDRLSELLVQGNRRIANLEELSLLSNATYHNEVVPANRAKRSCWLAKLKSKIAHCDFIFLDPDNGLQGRRNSVKHVSLNEMSELREHKRPILLYCHQDRTKGGIPVFAAKIRNRLRQIGIENATAVRLRPGTSRCYFMIDFDTELLERAKQFVCKWSSEAELV